MHYLAYVSLFRPCAREERDEAREPSMYYYTLPDEFVRTQMAVGALVLFGVLRVICAAMAPSTAGVYRP